MAGRRAQTEKKKQLLFSGGLKAGIGGLGSICMGIKSKAPEKSNGPRSFNRASFPFLQPRHGATTRSLSGAVVWLGVATVARSACYEVEDAAAAARRVQSVSTAPGRCRNACSPNARTHARRRRRRRGVTRRAGIWTRRRRLIVRMMTGVMMIKDRFLTPEPSYSYAIAIDKTFPNSLPDHCSPAWIAGALSVCPSVRPGERPPPAAHSSNKGQSAMVTEARAEVTCVGFPPKAKARWSKLQRTCQAADG